MRCRILGNFKAAFPSTEGLICSTEDYLGQLGHGIERINTDDWMVVLPGQPSDPRSRLPGVTGRPPPDGGRWFSVARDDVEKEVYLRTQGADELTAAIVEGYQRFLLGHYQGELLDSGT